MAKPKVKPQKQTKPQAAPKAGPPLTQPPSWPPIKQHLPLHAEPHPSAPDKILLVPNFLPPSLCRTYLSFVRGLPLTTTPGRPKRGDAVRVNDRFQVDDAAFAGRLYGVLRGVLEDPQFAHLWWVSSYIHEFHICVTPWVLWHYVLLASKVVEMGLADS